MYKIYLTNVHKDEKEKIKQYLEDNSISFDEKLKKEEWMMQSIFCIKSCSNEEELEKYLKENYWKFKKTRKKS